MEVSWEEKLARQRLSLDRGPSLVASSLLTLEQQGKSLNSYYCFNYISQMDYVLNWALLET